MESGVHAVLPVSLEDVKKTETQNLSSGCLWPFCCSHRVHNPAILLLLFAATACAVAPMFGADHGWAVWRDDDFQTEESMYVSMLKSLVMDHSEKGTDPSKLDVLNRIMPMVAASIKIRQGWLETVVDIQLKELHHLSTLKIATAQAALPKSLHHMITEIQETGKVTYRLVYQGDRLPARFTGILVLIVLGSSVLLALSVLTVWAIQGIYAPVQFILHKSWILSVIMFLTISVEYAVLAFGAHRETKVSPVFQHGCITRPELAWILAASAATFWALISITSRHKFMSVMPKKGPSSITSKSSWMIPVCFDEGDGSILESV